MACIQKKLLDGRTQLNVQLFLTRLITHRPKVHCTCTLIHSRVLSGPNILGGNREGRAGVMGCQGVGVGDSDL